MTYDEMKTQALASADAHSAELRRIFAEYEEINDPLIVLPGGDVNAALATGREVHLVAGGEYGAIRFPSNSRLVGNTAKVHGQSGPALYVPPSTTNVHIQDVECSSVYQCVIQLGDNGPTQTTREQVPTDITLLRPVILSHCHAQAKNGIENNAANVEVIDAVIKDVFNPNAIESHGIATLNTYGGLVLRGGGYEAGSTPCFSGGDTIKIPDTDISDVIYVNLVIRRPEAWRADGVNRNVKNLIEFKNAAHVTVANCSLSHCWGPIQRGYAVMLTPKVDGRVVNIEFRDNEISEVGGGFNILGRNPTGLDQTRTTDIRILSNLIQLDKIAYGPSATAWFMLIADGPGRILVENNEINHNGSALVYVDDSDRIESLIIRGNTAPVGAYGIRTPAGNNGDNWQQVFDELIVEGNTFSGASSVFKRNFPNNIYV